MMRSTIFTFRFILQLFAKSEKFMHNCTTSKLNTESVQSIHTYKISKPTTKFVINGRLHILHSQIRTPWNSNNDYDLSTLIREQPCMQMDFWQFYRNADIHIIPGKLSKTHLTAWLFSSPSGKVPFLLKSMRQICPLDFVLLGTCPHGLE